LPASRLTCLIGYVTVELKGTLTNGMTVTDFRDAYGRADNTSWRPSLDIDGFSDLVVNAPRRNRLSPPVRRARPCWIVAPAGALFSVAGARRGRSDSEHQRAGLGRYDNRQVAPGARAGAIYG